MCTDMPAPSSRPESGAVRISFDGVAPLSPAQVRDLIGQLVGELPVAPDEIELGPSGAGWVLYRDPEVTLDELTAAVLWMRRQPRIASVHWEMVVDVDP